MSITSMEDLKNKQAEVKKNLDGYTCRVLVCSGTGCIASGAQKIYEENVKTSVRESRVLRLRCKRMFLM